MHAAPARTKRLVQPEQAKFIEYKSVIEARAHPPNTTVDQCREDELKKLVESPDVAPSRSALVARCPGNINLIEAHSHTLLVSTAFFRRIKL
jgi:hypothetical protein